MKKYLVLIAAAITLGFTSCGEEDCNHLHQTTEEETVSLVGSWYNEPLNEEDVYSPNGTFYTKFNNNTISGESEGRWEYDKANKSLTWNYKFLGQNQYGDWKVKENSEYTLTISSSMNGEHTYGKIVETYQLEVGKTVNIKFATEHPDYQVMSYSSTNPRLASIKDDGTICAEGEKGTAYVKISTKSFDVWVKIIVGDNCADLWYNYPFVLGKTFGQMKELLGASYETVNNGFNYDLSTTSAYVNQVNVLVNNETGFINEIVLSLKDSAPVSEVLRYLKSHYYTLDFLGDNHYATCSELKNSSSIIVYNEQNRTINFVQPSSYPLEDFAYVFGKTRQEVLKIFGEPFYEYNNRMLYMLGTAGIAASVYFQLDDKTGKVTFYSINLNDFVDQEYTTKLLGSKYYFSKYFDEQVAYRYYEVEDENEAKQRIIYLVNNKSIWFYDIENFGK